MVGFLTALGAVLIFTPAGLLGYFLGSSQAWACAITTAASAAMLFAAAMHKGREEDRDPAQRPDPFERGRQFGLTQAKLAALKTEGCGYHVIQAIKELQENERQRM